MKNLLNPRWILIINTVPIILLFIIYIGQYHIIESLLPKEDKETWKGFGLALAILSIGNLLHAIWLISKKRSINLVYSIPTFILYTSFLYIYIIYNDQFIPSSIPRWMISSEVLFYPGTFLMPTLIHALLTVIVISIPKDKTPNPWLNFLYGLIFPLLAYLFFQIILPLWQTPESNYSTHVVIVLFIAATVLFLFFICRAIYSLTISKTGILNKYALLWKIIIAIVFPVLGLAVNNGLFYSKISIIGQSPFGDFSNVLFYLIASINGILLCLPKPKNENYRLLRFFALIACFPYTLYFFLIFLPFLPLSIVAIIAIGVGFLMLAPLLLFILQASEIYSECLFFADKYAVKMILIASIVSFSIIPSIITLYNLNDKAVLNSALNYVYENDYRQEKNINLNALANTLSTIKKNKNGDRSITSDGSLPFLTAYYNWLVLDNLTLSDVKIEMLDQVFFGHKPLTINNLTTSTNSAKISDLKTESRYDLKQKAWISTLNLTLKNTDTDGFASYETEFTLPEGCWVSDYHLYIGTKKEMGILAEKKSALWVFNQIRSENRDPGILYYLTGNKVAFKIFPFLKNETRKSGIEFIHKEPLTLHIDNHIIPLGDTSINPKVEVQSVANATYIPITEKAKLDLVQRKPEYHFIIDVSKGNSINKKDYINRIENYINVHQIHTAAIKINFANAYTNTYDVSENWKTKLDNQTFTGGFYLDGAIRQILLNAYKQQDKKYPVIIVVSNSFQNGIILKDFADLKIAFPESSNFFELDRENKTWVHSLIDKPLQRLQEINLIPTINPVYAWPNSTQTLAYLTNENLPSIVINNKDNEAYTYKEKSWEAGLAIQGLWIANNIKVQTAKNANINLIKKSMLYHILSPLTSFIVVENKAQKMMLKKKQEQILAGNKNLDLDEETQSMAEPNLYLLLILVSIFLLFNSKYYKQLKSKLL